MIKRIKILATGALLLAGLGACSPSGKKTGADSTVDTLRTAETVNLLNNLRKVPTQGIMFGHHDDPLYGVGWEGDEDRSDVKSVCGDYPAVMSFDLGHIELEREKSLDNVPFRKIRQETINQYKRGGVVSFSWHLDNPLTGKDAWDVSDTTVVASILPGGVHHAKFISWLDAVAAFMNTLETEEGTKIPVIFRPWHEHTGSWFWWGQNLCTADQFSGIIQLRSGESKNTNQCKRNGKIQQIRTKFPPAGLCAIGNHSHDRIESRIPYPGNQKHGSYHGSRQAEYIGIKNHQIGPEQFPEHGRSHIAQSVTDLLFQCNHGSHSILGFLISSISDFVQSGFSVSLPKLRKKSRPEECAGSNPPTVR
jgi:hypothetical protein